MAKVEGYVQVCSVMFLVALSAWLLIVHQKQVTVQPKIQPQSYQAIHNEGTSNDGFPCVFVNNFGNSGVNSNSAAGHMACECSSQHPCDQPILDPIFKQKPAVSFTSQAGDVFMHATELNTVKWAVRTYPDNNNNNEKKKQKKKNERNESELNTVSSQSDDHLLREQKKKQNDRQTTQGALLVSRPLLFEREDATAKRQNENRNSNNVPSDIWSDTSAKLGGTHGSTKRNTAHNKAKLTVDLGPKLIGFGGAFTDAAAAVFFEGMQDNTLRQNMLDHYFSQTKGIGYNVGRVPMGSCDFSRRSYELLSDPKKNQDANNNSEGPQSRGFCILDDGEKPECGKDSKLDLIKLANNLRKANSEEPIKIFFSPWSAPPWMKEAPSQEQHEEKNISTSSITSAHSRLDRVGDDTIVRAAGANVNDDKSDTDVITVADVENKKTLPTSEAAAPNNKIIQTERIGAHEGGGRGGQFINGRLRPDMYAEWAKMFVSFAQEYSKRGVELWGLTMQNEAQSKATWEAMLWETDEAVTFMADHLGPLIRNTPETKHIKIMTHDDQFCNLLTFGMAVSTHPRVAPFVDGIAYHWYNSLAATLENTTCLATMVGGGVNVYHATQQFSGKNYANRIKNHAHQEEEQQQQQAEKQEDQEPPFFLSTEACNGYLPAPFVIGDLVRGPLLGSWSRGYRYSRDILAQLANGASGWVDWNLFLDSLGGPNHAANNVDAPILLGQPLASSSSSSPPKKQKGEGSFYYLQPMFFHIAHFSAFLPPGSRRVPCTVSAANRELGLGSSKSSASVSSHIEAIAFQVTWRSSGEKDEKDINIPSDRRQIVMVLLNDCLSMLLPSCLFLRDASLTVTVGRMSVDTVVPKHSIQTLTVDVPQDLSWAHVY